MCGGEIVWRLVIGWGMEGVESVGMEGDKLIVLKVVVKLGCGEV